MNALIIYCHPSRDSYTFQVLSCLEKELKQRGWCVEISDLYANEFRSELSASEYDRETARDYSSPIPEDVVAEHEKLEHADLVFFLYPVWWSDCPARLKGWFDRVWSAGFVYKVSEGKPQLKPIRRGIVLCTAGYSNSQLKEMGIMQSMENVMLNDRLGPRFISKQMVVLGGTLEIDKTRSQHQRRINELVAELK